LLRQLAAVAQNVGIFPVDDRHDVDTDACCFQENTAEVEMSVEPRHHRHFVSRKADVLRQISDECGAVTITFPRIGSKSDKVVLKGAKQCVDAARQRILDIVTDLVRTSLCPVWVLGCE